MARRRGKISEVERHQATIVAEELLTGMTPEPAIIGALVKQYAMSRQQATSIIKAATERLTKPFDADTEQRRAKLEGMCFQVYRKAIGKGAFNPAMNAVNQLSKMWGLDAPHKIVHSGKVNVTDSEFSSRSEEELNFYAENGYWPEEAPDAPVIAQTQDSADPLSELPPLTERH